MHCELVRTMVTSSSPSADAKSAQRMPGAVAAVR